MLNTPLIALLSVLAAAILGAVGQYLFKTAADRTTGGALNFLISPWVLSGMVCYLTVMVLFTYAFKRGGTVTVLYPLYASTFIWAAVIALLLYGQPIRPVHLAGMLLLVSGMYLMGVGNASPT